MEQPVPVFQQRFNLPLAYKQPMFVQLTCKQATCTSARPRLPHSWFLALQQGDTGQGTRDKQVQDAQGTPGSVAGARE